MTMGDETPVTTLILPVLIRPILSQLERRDVSASQTLRAALSKAESSFPGLTYDLVVGILRRGELNVNMNESILRLQGALNDSDVVEYRLNRSEDAFQELNKKSATLKKILSRIPDEITDRKTFLEIIKEIASAIKKLLDAVNEVNGFIPGPTGKQALDQRKREFVKYSKRFSNTLKEYFKEGHANSVFVSALYLIHQTNMIISTVKSKCE
ncbi:PREDICTED: programmed cell death protein 10 [Nicrophorus vespilloides]|uniref:Programmed cell death protein 10 n=1 Tax=Nicrophorus vespilloides TaxID=110193 RepID=A0ABM1NCD6_NICVS|nr:PREDICTED: programmed cell death protein 10 [Nicrophorus vespilloides]XP_017784486.1 PREDICTED: programmed cell death protein 10 [Nicrophorus vespilloides]XP_017784487.1 PREDICTED: programmed cell death protein 10 [Nicrophorus vespilloides]XP_017784488.1 PREDICTED: programmed cell death protein 10 [Nicrophorus vespilloides]